MLAPYISRGKLKIEAGGWEKKIGRMFTYLSMAMQAPRTSGFFLIAFHLFLSTDQTASFASRVFGAFADGLAIAANHGSGGRLTGSGWRRCPGADTRCAASDRRKRVDTGHRRRVGGAGGLTAAAHLLNAWDALGVRMGVLQGGWTGRNIAGRTSCAPRRERWVIGDRSVERGGLELESVLASDSVGVVGWGMVVVGARGVRLGVAVGGRVVLVRVKGWIANRIGGMGKLMRERG